MKNSRNGAHTAISAVCAALFVVITFLYFYSFQGDIIGMTQYSWSHHETSYDRLTGGVIFTALALLIKIITSAILSFPTRVQALSYFPAMMLSGVVTSGTVDDDGHVSISWKLICLAIVLLMLFPVVVSHLNRYYSYNNPFRGTRSYIVEWRNNVMILLLSVVVMYSMGNTDRTLHTRLAVERLCHEGKYDKALDYGIPKYDHDMALTMWRAYALSRQSSSFATTNMGEHLFNYNIGNKQSTLLPRSSGEPHALLRDCYPIWQSLGFVPRNIDESPVSYLQRELRRGTARPASKDYLLCTALVNKDLCAFIDLLSRYYDSNHELPKHYAEAVMIYKSRHRDANSHKSLDSLKVGETIKADYYDFLQLLRSKKPIQEKQADIKDNYFGTYWYYYYKR